MALVFDSVILPPEGASEPFGCIQRHHLPPDFIPRSDRPTRCPTCSSPMFLLEDLSTYACPICDPENVYAKSTFRFASAALDSPPFFLVIDIAISSSQLTALLSAFSAVLDEGQRIVLIFLTNCFVIGSVVNSVLVLDSVSTARDIGSRFVTASDLGFVIAGAAPSVFALRPADLPRKVDPYAAIDFCLRLAGGPFTFFGFFARPLTERSFAENELLVGRLLDTQSRISLGVSTEDFRRAAAICLGSLGCVFRFPTISPALLRHLVIQSAPISYVVNFPTSLTVTSLTGCLGATVQPGRLAADRIVGGSVRFVRTGPVSCAMVRVVERVITSGWQFLTLHTIQNSGGFSDMVDTRVADTILLKEWAVAVLDDIAAGGDFGAAVRKALDRRVKDVLLRTQLRNIGRNQQIDIYRLYFIARACGDVDMSATVGVVGGKWVLVDLPMVFLLTDGAASDEAFGDWEWPVEVHVIRDRNVFLEVLHSAGVDIPQELL